MMGKRYCADVRVDLRVFFIDNGKDALVDQALEAVNSGLHSFSDDIEDDGTTVLRVEPRP